MGKGKGNGHAEQCHSLAWWPVPRKRCHGDTPHWHGAGVAFPRSGFSSAMCWCGIVSHPVSALVAAMSELSCVSYVIAVWGMLQSLSSPQPSAELPTPGDRHQPQKKHTPSLLWGSPTSCPCFHPCQGHVGNGGEQSHSLRSLSPLG